jgi:hypothetical protein
MCLLSTFASLSTQYGPWAEPASAGGRPPRIRANCESVFSTHGLRPATFSLGDAAVTARVRTPDRRFRQDGHVLRIAAVLDAIELLRRHVLVHADEPL